MKSGSTCLRDLEELHSLAAGHEPDPRQRHRTVHATRAGYGRGAIHGRAAVLLRQPRRRRRQVPQFLHGSSVANLVLSQIERQAASCLFGVVESLAEVVRTGKVLSRGDSDGEDDEGEVLLPPELKSEAADLLEQARRLPPEDPKLDRSAAPERHLGRRRRARQAARVHVLPQDDRLSGACGGYQ